MSNKKELKAPDKIKANEGKVVATFDVTKLSGIEKSALLMLSLTPEDAAQIFRNLEPKQVQRLGMKMASLDDSSQEKVSSVHRSFVEEIQKHSNIGLDSEDFVRASLIEALGKDKAGNLVDQIILGCGSSGLDSLKWMDARQVASIIQNEHPQIQTIVLSYLEPEQAAEILTQFSERNRLDLMMRIADLEEVQPAALQELNEIMEKQFAGQAGAQSAKMGGMKAAADIMNFLEGGVEAPLMESIRDADEDMGDQIQELMFVFENLIDVEDRGIQALLREIPSEQLQRALKSADEELKDKLLGNMSKRAADMLRDDLEAMAPIRVSEVEAAQKEILTIARRLADSGEIALGSGGGDDFL
ncbi:MAG: flagellar motor switch protein FliG [Psychromonas sp.]|nr:flagellar motor switch protein FliG [Psychromonas sp.]